MNVVFNSQINGEFSGFSGDTVFRFMNGQVWQQSTYHYKYHYAYCPKASVYQSANGGYQLRVDGMNTAVDVVPVQVVTEGIIVSEFNGYAINNVFQFRNGQLWKQTEAKHINHHTTKPDAMVIDGINGRELWVEGMEETVKVKRMNVNY